MGGQVLPGGQVQEHRLEVGLNRGELRDVQALIGQQPGDDCKIELVIVQAHLDSPVLELDDGEACRSEYVRGPQMVRHSNTRREVPVRGEDLIDVSLGQQPATSDDRHGVRDLLYLSENVAGDEHRLSPASEVLHHGADLVNAGRVETIGRLVEDQQVRVFEQRRGYRKALFHAK